MGPRAIGGIQEALSSSDGLPWGLIFMALALLGIFVLFTYLTVVQVQRSKRLKAEWEEFARIIAGRGLSQAQKALARELARRDAPTHPADVVRRPEVFERAVHRHLKRLGSPEDAQRAGGVVRALREKLGLRRSGAAAYYSTRMLPAGQEVFLALTDDPSSAIKARVAEPREDLLALQDLEPASRRLRGAEVQVTFYPPKGAFSFTTDVVSVNAGNRTCLLEHSAEVGTATRRRYLRVQMDAPIAFRAAWEGDEVSRSGRLQDLSAGGLSVEAPCYYEANETLVFDVDVARYLRKDAEDLGARPISGTVLRTPRSGDDRCVYHVEFRQVSEDDRRFLMELVRRVERASRRG
jgi:c-di-GMP-binding flagellar brake protein YcgR